jgi:hypothetical protein
MQLTLRDYFWLTIVVGLAIGIVIEHYDVRALRHFEGKAQWWEQAARQMGEKAGEKDGLVPDFKEFKHWGLKKHKDDEVWQEVDFMHLWGTEDKEQTIVTGHWDLDFLLLLLIVVAPLSALLAMALRKSYPAGGKAYSKASIRSYRWMGPVSLLMLLAFCLSGYHSRRPFTATLTFTMLVFFAGHYWLHNSLRLTPELEQQIDENYKKAVNITGWFKLGK